MPDLMSFATTLLHKVEVDGVSGICWWLDHRITPETTAVLSAMVSRIPEGGILQRYKEIVLATAREMFGERSSYQELTFLAEMRLTTYPLPVCIHNPDFDPKTFDRKTGLDGEGRKPGFLNLHVGMYGHASPKELTGTAVFFEEISLPAAMLSFHNPLVRGQEMSTRARWKADWAMGVDVQLPEGHPLKKDVEAFHREGLYIAAAERTAWMVELRRNCLDCEGAGCLTCKSTGKKYPEVTDPQPFRPAFDKARWALPCTVSTGVVHCADIRVMGRVIQLLRSMATASNHEAAMAVCTHIEKAYAQALPGFAGSWNIEAYHDQAQGQRNRMSARRDIPQSFDWSDCAPSRREPYLKDSLAQITSLLSSHSAEASLFVMTNPVPGKKRKSTRSYADPTYDTYKTYTVLKPSVAAGRDWHRHRSAMPWIIRPAFDSQGHLVLSPQYEPLSDYGKQNVTAYLDLSQSLFDAFLEEGNQWMAMACLCLGHQLQMIGHAGLSKALYMHELRGYVAGANFEYQAQARACLADLAESLCKDDPGAYDNLLLSAYR